MQKLYIISLLLIAHRFVFCLGKEPTFLILNHFDRDIPEIDSNLVINFSEFEFQFTSPLKQLIGELDQIDNPASWQMDFVKEIGVEYNVDFILFNQIEHQEKRFLLEGQFYSTRSGGLLNRRKIDLSNYEDCQLNELNMWIGDIIQSNRHSWDKKRQSILYLDPDKIIHEKTPMKSAMRSLLVPGWGQLYSGKNNSAGLWAGTESALIFGILVSLFKYDEAVKNFKSYEKSYNNTDDEKEIAYFRKQAEINHDNHILFNNLVISFVGATSTGWLANSIHAWIVGPRPNKNIYKKWDLKNNSDSG